MPVALNVALAALVAAAGIGTAAAAGDDPQHGSRARSARDGPVIEDTAGRFVARLASSGENTGDNWGAALIAFEQGNLLVGLGLHADPATGATLSSGLGWRPGLLFFVADGCVGTPYMWLSLGVGGRRFVTSQFHAGQWVAYVASAGPAQRLSVRSMRDSGGNCRATIDRHVPWSIVALPVQTTFSLDDYGRPPFYVD